MRSALRNSAIASAAAGVVLWTAMLGVAQTPAYRAPRTADGKPNLNGIWQALNTADWDLQGHAAGKGPVPSLGAVFLVPPGLGVVEGDEIPYLPAAAAKKKENQANWVKLDPEVKCYLPGVPRATYLPYPFQIVQSPADDHDGLRIRWRGSRHQHGRPDQGARRQLDGVVQRPLGG